MVTILKTRKFYKWLLDLKDLKGKARIQVRLDRLELGHFGDCSTIESGLFELRIMVLATEFILLKVEKKSSSY
jgi:putative addiction module killer protein